uniref:Centromere protein U n=1 Tax=Lepisosteus oculatus TaxID=7918 RepID=W5N8K2_LEPOC|nr:PREDICTED: centromere protein U [Lepisosteus oculatus]XP_015201151.1 PREDICTED: centromere protein U [Lepisosteus oculatus]XP_015201152.1 PREDICTED: centromere protein U [Lepisosteus oculatus]
MSARKRRAGKTVKNAQDGSPVSDDPVDLLPTQKFTSPNISNLSLIPRTSFFDEEESVPSGAPLHSTALEEELRKGGRGHKGLAKTKAPVKRLAGSLKKRGAGARTGPRPAASTGAGPPKSRTSSQRSHPPAAKQIPEEEDSSSEEGGSAEQKGRSPPVESDASESWVSARTKSSVAAESRSRTGGISEASRSRATSRTLDQSGPSQASVSEEEGAVGGQSPAARKGTGRGRQRRRLSPSSEDDTNDEDSDCENKPSGSRRSWPSDGAQKRKSSSSSGSDGPPQSKKPPKDLTELDVVLAAFQDFVSEYKETGGRDVAKRAIETLSTKFVDQLTDTIHMTKELKQLKRENSKTNSAINRKRSRLLEVKHELRKRQTELRELQKEHAQLSEKRASLEQGTALLGSLKALQRAYLRHRQAHPAEREEYGPSSLPSLLLEMRSVLGVEHQLLKINTQLQDSLEQLSKKS